MLLSGAILGFDAEPGQEALGSSPCHDKQSPEAAIARLAPQESPNGRVVGQQPFWMSEHIGLGGIVFV